MNNKPPNAPQHTNEVSHTPTPWQLGVENEYVEGINIWHGPVEFIANVRGTKGMGNPQEVAKANAAFIVKAVNAHEDLVGLVKELKEVVADAYAPLGETLKALVYSADKALARAEGK